MEELMWALELSFTSMEVLHTRSIRNNVVAMAFCPTSYGLTPLSNALQEEGYLN